MKRSGGGRRPTSADVARVAGVSRSTVSYVLNETPGARVSAETRLRVLTAVQAVGYVANAAASDLRRGTSRTVLLIIGQGRGADAVTAFARGLSQILHGSGLTLCSVQAAKTVTADDARTWAAMRPVAVLNLGASLSEHARRALVDCGTVIIGEDDADVPLRFDQGLVAAAGVRAMHERGRRRLLQVLPAEKPLADLTRARVTAFRRAAGKGCLGTLRMPLTSAGAAAVVASMRQAMPDGIVAHNDDYAAALMAALHDAGIAVPAEVAVIGVDNTAWSAWIRPALSTIGYDASDLLAQLAQCLRLIASGGPMPDAITPNITAHIIHRATT